MWTRTHTHREADKWWFSPAAYNTVIVLGESRGVRWLHSVCSSARYSAAFRDESTTRDKRNESFFHCWKWHCHTTFFGLSSILIMIHERNSFKVKQYTPSIFSDFIAVLVVQVVQTAFISYIAVSVTPNKYKGTHTNVHTALRFHHWLQTCLPSPVHHLATTSA